FPKTMWTIFVIFVPFLGALVYLIARGDSMAQRQVDAARQHEAAFQDYVKQTAGTPSSADEIAKLAALKDQGVLTEQEFAAQKAKLLT
ncbi:SHOCT domain-containing protein, partial [Enterobacter hormaechei]|uniref:SHOCT domain-containing protein n=1 Tax=Enterobacter hormaechei TaxID=158836 RepID=UPI002930702E